MTGESTKLSGTTTKIIVVLVAVIIIAAAVIIVVNNNDGDKEIASGTVETSAIYGNVNGDYYIDDTDIEAIQDIINGDRSFADYPLADADCDGDVDDDDLAIVRAAANGESTTLNVVNYLGETVSVSYPVTDYATTGGTNFRSVIAVLGLAEDMIANGTNSYISSTLDKELYDGKADGSIITLSGTSLTTDDVTTLVNAGVKIVLSEENGMASSDEIVQLLTGAGITYLELNFAGTYDVLDSTKALGILLQCEEVAEDYCEWSLGVMNTIVENTGDLYGTATVLTVVMTNSVSGTSADYYQASIDAGGNNIADWESSTQKFNSGDTWLYDEKYNADYIFHFRSMTFPNEPSSSVLSSTSGYFSETYTYQNGGYYLINGVLPLTIRNAIMAETMYSDCFDEGWAEGLFQYYFDHFLQQDFDVSSVEYIWNLTS